MIVVKVGGGEGIDTGPLLANVAQRQAAGEKLVIVHGGSHETNRIAEALGHPPHFVTGPSGRQSRYTDRATLEIFEMVYAGKVNTTIVESLQAQNVPAVGLSGVDGRLLYGRRKATVRSVENGKTKILRGDHTGTVDQVNDALLTLLLNAGYVPVISPPGMSDDGVAVNVDGDRAAGAIATALNADALVILSNVPGLLKDLHDPSSLVRHVDADRPDEVAPYVQGRMHAKLDGAVRAIKGGVGRVVLASANVPQPLDAALQGEGTVVQ